MKFIDAAIKASKKAKERESSCYDCSYLLLDGKETSLHMYADGKIHCNNSIDIIDLISDRWDAE